ncbi:hypothetical protein DFH94DRAFT_855629 [Russula ochroleuca]|uniref:Uncharacterized protein n=1 Tax=Russula ochroleuca TaxID=152965 RepID=A0A9P5JZP8_9AGAM|nr:hypothetical protein DFH94DRAFT_855629 [Russula ochroleuca]
MNEIRTRQSSTSVDMDVPYPPTGSLPISSSNHLPQTTDRPFSIDYSTIQSSPVSPAVDLHGEPLPSSPTSSNHPTLDLNWPEGRFVQLINSDQIPRYEKNATIPRVETAYDVQPLTTEFPYFPEPNGSEQDSLQQDCSPWIPATHPDGALYFYDEERRLFTDTDMHNQIMRDEIEDFYNYLQRVIHIKQLSIPSKNYDLVLDIMVTGNDEHEKRISWSYYYACHKARCLFWLETYDASYMTSELFGVKSPAHVKHRLESLFWSHWSLFPVVFADRRLPLDAYDELSGILLHGCVDVLTSKSSTLPYDNDEMRRMIQLVQGAKDAKGGLAYYTAGITRLLSFFAHWRFLYFHGQKHARLIKDQSVYDKPRSERSLLITILSPLLFLAPEVHLHEFEELWTDEVIIKSAWKSVMTKIVQEWGDTILGSTVLLTVNIGFLAIPGAVISNLNGANITSASQVVIFTSPSQIASSLSVVGSIGSIIIALLLIRHNRTKQNEDPGGASTYLYQNSHRIFGLEPMAIIFSLPWALLMWSIVIFFIALLLFCFSISNILSRIFIAIVSVLVITLIIWSIRTAWDSAEHNDDVWYKSLVVFRRARVALFERVKEFIPFHTRRVPVDRITLNSGVNEGRV